MFTRVKPLGWAFLEILTSTQMNQLDTNVSRAIDGLNGGAYTLAVMLELKGAGVKFSSVAEFNECATSFTDGTVTVNAGVAWAFNNDPVFNGQAKISGAGGSLLIESGAVAENHGSFQNKEDGIFANEGLMRSEGKGRYMPRTVYLPNSDENVSIEDGDRFILPPGATRTYTVLATGALEKDVLEFWRSQDSGGTFTFNYTHPTIGATSVQLADFPGSGVSYHELVLRRVVSPNGFLAMRRGLPMV